MLFLRLETIVLMLLGIGIIIIGPHYAGGPITRDELYYMTTAMEPFPSSRGFHIYFLKLFLSVSEPLQAARIYWAWVVAITSMLVYVNAQLLAPTPPPLIGIVALLLFWSPSSLFRLAGVAYSDYTVMLMVTLGTTLYLLYHRTHHRILLIAFGMVLFFAMESKPTGMCLATLLIGLGIPCTKEKEQKNHAEQTGWDTLQRHGQLWLRNLLLVGLGLALGQTIFMILNHFFQPHILSGTQNYAVVQSVKTIQHPATDFFPRDLTWTWYTTLLEQGTFLLILLLYMLSLSPTHQLAIPPAAKIVWLMPPVVILFLTAATMQVEFGGDRHIVLLLPIIAVLAAYALPLTHIRPFLHTRQHYLIAVAGAIALALAAYTGIYALLGKSKRWTPNDFHALLDMPAGLILLVITLLWGRTRPLFALTGWLLAVLMMTLYPLTQIPTVMQHTRERSTNYMYPATRFTDQMIVSDEMTLFVSSTLPQQTAMLSEDREVVAWIVSVVQNRSIEPDHVTLSPQASALLTHSSSYAFLTKRDVALLHEQTARNIRPFATSYMLTYDMEHDLVFAAHAEENARRATAVLMHSPDDLQARLIRATSRLHSGKPEDALADYTQVLTQDPHHVPAIIGRSNALAATGAYTRALNDLEHALTIAPENIEALVAHGCLAAKQGNMQRARTDFNIVLEAHRLYPTRILPRAWYDSIITALPSSSLGYARRGYAQMDIEFWNDALADYTTAIHMAPTSPLAYAGRGKLYRLRGLWAHAIDDIKYVLEQEPDDPWGYYEMGLIYAEMGQAYQASGYLRTALAFSTDATLNTDIRKRLPSLKPWQQWVQR